MANPTAGFGLRLAGRRDGAAQSFQLEEVQIAYNNANTFGTGDLVIALTTGFIDKYVAAGTQVKGVFMGCWYFSPVVGRTVWSQHWAPVTLPATTIVKALVATDPAYLFEIRGSQTALINQAAIGANADVVVGTPNLVTGQSSALLDTTTMDATATFPLRIFSIGSNPSVDNTLVGNIALVSLNTSVYRTNTGV